MNTYEVSMFGLTIGLVILVVFALTNQWAIAVSFLLVLLIITILRIWVKNRFQIQKRKREVLIALLSERLETIEKMIGNIRDDFRKDMFSIESRIEQEINHKKYGNKYRELARKTIELENRLNNIRKTMGAGFGALEDRIRNLEK